MKTISSFKPAIPEGEYERTLLQSVAVEKLNFIDLKKPVVIIVDDHTRGTPVKSVLPFLWNNLKKIGVVQSQVTILVANGTHRHMTNEELREKLGEFLDMFNVVQHDCDKDNLMVGTKDDIPIYLNKLVVKTPNVLGIGSVVAHKFSGWSGGSKLICPGVSGYETIFLTHERAIVEEKIKLGQKDNWFRSFMNYVSKLANLKFLVNFVTGSSGPLAVFGGEPHKVFNEAVSEASRFLSRYIEKQYDVSIISAYPSIKDLWQTGKVFYTGDIVTKKGGHIFVVSPIEDGFGDHADFVEFLKYDLEELKSLIHQRVTRVPLVIGAAIAVREILDNKKITLVTHNKNVSTLRIGNFEIVHDFEELETKGKDLIVLEDSYVLPVIQSGGDRFEN